MESEGSNDSDIDIDEVVLRKEITEICKNHAETGPNFNDETKQQGTTRIIKTHNHYQ